MRNNTTVAQRYQKMSATRSQYIRIAEKCASFTLPYLFPPNKTADSTFIAPTQIQYTSAGAEATNFLANRLVTLLFPPNKAFFRAVVPDEIIKKQGASVTEVENVVARLEKTATSKFIASVSREHLLQACLHLIVGGNVCFIKQANGSRYFSLHNYVCRRASSNGKLLRLIIKEKLEIESIPKEYLKYVPADKLNRADIDDKNSRITLWTEAVWNTGSERYVVTQYFEDTPVLQNVYTEEEMPIMALTWTLLSGEDYGHGYCEDYLGSINSAGTLAEALTQLSLVVSKITNLVNPASELAFNLEELSNSKSGDYFVGKEGDITQVASNKLADMQAVMANYDMHVNTIRRAFLQNSAVQRDAERVTAEEIRYMANELETSQGGIYSHLANTWQKQLARLSLTEALEALGDNGKQLARLLDIQILTGIESLSRTLESDSTLNFIQELTVLNQLPEWLLSAINIPNVVKRLATNSDMPNPQEVLAQPQEQQEPTPQELA